MHITSFRNLVPVCVPCAPILLGYNAITVHQSHMSMGEAGWNYESHSWVEKFTLCTRTDVSLNNHHISPFLISSACYTHLQIYVTHTHHTHTLKPHTHTLTHTKTHTHTHKPHMLVSHDLHNLSIASTHRLQCMPMFHSFHYLLVSHNLVLTYSIPITSLNLIASSRCLCLIHSLHHMVPN